MSASTPTDIVLRRPPRNNTVTIADNPLPVESAMPVTSPTRPWDRLRVSVTQEHRDTEDTPQLHLPLPEDARDGIQYAGPILIYAVDILLGQRPISALRHWLAPDVYNVLARRAGLAYRIHGKANHPHPPKVSRIIWSRPQPRVLEVAATIHDGVKIRAAATRFEFRKNRWKVVALDIG